MPFFYAYFLLLLVLILTLSELSLKVMLEINYGNTQLPISFLLNLV
jgi:hypothetical protein